MTPCELDEVRCGELISTRDVPADFEHPILQDDWMVSSVLNIQTSETVKRVEIYNLQGKLMKVVEGANEVSVSELSAGSYFLRLTTDKGVSAQGFIKH